ncbi:MAG: hypothetical protein WCJ25_01310 [Candidatus Moraniibacteriota bacterium]
MGNDPMVTSSDVHSAAEGTHPCERCRKAKEHEEIAFAFLLALMPVITLTLFGNMGLL